MGDSGGGRIGLRGTLIELDLQRGGGLGQQRGGVISPQNEPSFARPRPAPGRKPPPLLSAPASGAVRKP